MVSWISAGINGETEAISWGICTPEAQTWSENAHSHAWVWSVLQEGSFVIILAQIPIYTVEL